MNSLWAATRLRLSDLGSAQSQELEDVSVLLAAALSSKHKAIVCGAIEVWNSTFGDCERLAYPENVAIALARLRRISNLKLPTFPDVAESDVSRPCN